jgi:hypothetical protein
MTPTQDPVKWTDSVSAISTTLALVIPLLTYIDGKRKGKSLGTTLTETLLKGELVFINSSASILNTTKNIVSNSEFIENMNANIFDKKKELEDKLKALKTRFQYSQEARYWLEDNRKALSTKASRYIFNKHPEIIDINPDIASNEKKEQIDQQINFYLYLISGCLKFGRPNLIEKSSSIPVVQSRFYIEAFAFIKESIIRNISSEELSKEASSEIILYLDKLINTICTTNQ